MAKLSNPYLLIGVLIITVLASGVMCHNFTSSVKVTDAVYGGNGSTVIAGDLLVDNANIRKEPVIANPSNLIRPLTHGDIITFATSIFSGAAPKDIIKNESYIQNDGHISDELEGIGKVEIDENGLISVEKADEIIWAYKYSDVYAVKSGDSINLVKNNETIKTLSVDEINNDSVPTDYVSAEELKSWFEDAKDGSNITVDYYLGGFSDNRTSVHGKENITHLFGEDTYDYMLNYTPGNPVLVYDNNATWVQVSNGVSYLESLAEYPTEVRASNAREFARGWNGTFVPANGSAHGKDKVSFTSIAESEAASGSATHGVCPPGRSLRAAWLSLGNPLPVGMSGDYESILYEYRPTIDVQVTNINDYPVVIIMWTEGEGGATTTYTEVYKLVDNQTNINNTTDISNSTNISNSTDIINTSE
jgi:hypothetical protein